jgi:hypothetical protein
MTTKIKVRIAKVTIGKFRTPTKIPIRILRAE